MTRQEKYYSLKIWNQVLTVYASVTTLMLVGLIGWIITEVAS